MQGEALEARQKLLTLDLDLRHFAIVILNAN